MQRSRFRAFHPLLALALFATLAVGAGASSRPTSEPHDQLASLEQRVSALEIDDLTREACYAEIDASRERQLAAREQVYSAHQQLRALLEQDDPPEEQVMLEADHIAGLVAEARKAELRALLRILSLLDEDARAELRTRPALSREAPFGSEGGPEPRSF